MKAFTVRLDDEIHKELKHKLIDKDISMQKYINDLIKKDLEEQKKKDSH